MPCFTLKVFTIIPQMIKTIDFSPSRRELLEEMSHQAEVLDRISCLLLEKNDNITAGDSQLKMYSARLRFGFFKCFWVD